MSETANEAAGEARRHHLYERARGTWDEEAAETLITSLPHPAADLATKRDVAEVRTEVAMLRSEMAEQIGGLRSDMADQIGGLRSETVDRIGSLRSEMQAQLRAQTRWTISVVLVAMGLIEAIGRVG